MNKPKRKMGISASSYTQFTDCQRKWYIGYIIKPDVPKTPALQTGIDVHDWLEAYLKGEELPDIGEKLVNIAKAGLEYLPEPGTVNVEEWVEDVCGPLPFRGKVDFYTCEDGILHISDHKTTSRSSNAKTEAELALNPQMLAYAYVLARKLEIQPKTIKFSHIYYLTKSKIATSFRVDAEAKWSDVEKNWKDFERVAKVMARLAKAEHQKAIMPDVSKCRFCWFKEHCEAYPKKDKKTKPKTKSKSGESDMDIMNKIREQKAKQAAAKLAKAKADADLANLELQAATAEVADIDHPLAPTESIDWKKLGDLLIEAIEGREAEGDLFMKATLFEFLEFQLDREIKQEDADKLMEACGHRLVQGDNYVSVVKEEPVAVGGLSDYIDQMLKYKSTKNLPKGWTLTQVESFWKKALMGLSSTPILDDITTRTMAKEASSGTRLPRSSTIKALVAWVLECNVPIELAAEDCALRLGVSKHEQEMADKLGALLPSAPKPEKVEEPKPEKVEEPKTHLKPVGKLEADLVVTTSPEPTTADTPVIVYVNAFPSDHIPTKLSAVLEPLQEEVAEEHGLPYYHLVKYEKGPSHVVSKVLALLNGCHASKLLGKSVFASQKDPCLAELLPILERRDDVVIVRGFIG
jgi:CRISPR/Cas system-associated exonuclease Cas4 (RecB family)